MSKIAFFHEKTNIWAQKSDKATSIGWYSIFYKNASSLCARLSPSEAYRQRLGRHVTNSNRRATQGGESGGNLLVSIESTCSDLRDSRGESGSPRRGSAVCSRPWAGKCRWRWLPYSVRWLPVRRCESPVHSSSVRCEDSWANRRRNKASSDCCRWNCLTEGNGVYY